MSANAPRRETHAHPQPSFRKRNPHRVADSTLPVPFNSLPKSYVRAIPGLRPNIAAWSEAPDGSEFLTDSIHSLNDVAVPEEDTESGANRGETNNGGGEKGSRPRGPPRLGRPRSSGSPPTSTDHPHGQGPQHQNPRGSPEPSTETRRPYGSAGRRNSRRSSQTGAVKTKTRVGTKTGTTC